jgi:hypothetical protein
MLNMMNKLRDNFKHVPILAFKNFTGALRFRDIDVVPNSYELHMLQKRQAIQQIHAWHEELHAARTSVYYWWWVFLQESDEYQAALLRKDVSPEVKAVAKDFGKINNVNFDIWWFKTGRYLFAQQRVVPFVRELENGFTIYERRQNHCVYLEVPLAVKRSWALKQVNEILGKHFKGEDGGRHNVYAYSSAKYEANKSSKMRLSTFKQFRGVWQIRKHQPELEWWKIGETLKISPTFINRSNTPKMLRASNNRNMTLTVQRIYRKTEKLIYFAARGEFPRVK